MGKLHVLTPAGLRWRISSGRAFTPVCPRAPLSCTSKKLRSFGRSIWYKLNYTFSVVNSQGGLFFFFFLFFLSLLCSKQGLLCLAALEVVRPFPDSLAFTVPPRGGRPSTRPLAGWTTWTSGPMISWVSMPQLRCRDYIDSLRAIPSLRSPLTSGVTSSLNSWSD